MKNIKISIECCVRYFKQQIKRNDFLTFQIPLPIRYVGKEAVFYLKHIDGNHKNNIIKQEFIIEDTHITFFNSHEDPILKDEQFVYLSLHTPTEIIPKNFKTLELSLDGFEEHTIKYTFEELTANKLFHNMKSIITGDGYCIQSNEATTLTLHLGDKNGLYKEEFFKLEERDSFNFKQYLKDYVYIGLQCSYENKIPEIEEKHIIKGQKGIYETAIIKDCNGEIISQGLLDFDDKYLNTYQDKEMQENGFKEVLTIYELVEFHSRNPIQYFESSLPFLYPEYISKNTYSQSRLFKTGKSRKHHIDLKVCKNCSLNTECLQVIPSGLSEELFKRNLKLKSFKDCSIYVMIKEKKA